MGYSGSGQVVAVLDNGFDKDHLFLHKIIYEACYSASNSALGIVSLCPGGVTSSTAPGSAIKCTPALESCWHGTHVAGIIAGNAGVWGDGTPISGVAKDAKLIAIQVFFGINNPTSDPRICNGYPACTSTRDSLVISALERVLALRGTYNIAAVNMSLGGGKYTNQVACDSENAAMKKAIDSLLSVGIATVVASGNEGFIDGVAAPACISSAVSVGSTSATYGIPGENNCDGHSLGTAFPDSISCFSNSASFLSLLAPGDKILSSVPASNTSLSKMSGT
jgi:subtilisin family serine protease